MTIWNARRVRFAHKQRKNDFNFAILENLRIFQNCLFTGGVVKGNCSCRAAFCESAALWGSFCWSTPSQALPRQLPRRGSQAVTLVAKASGIMRKLPAVLLPLPLGEVSPQVTERAHAVSPVSKVLNVMRNFPAPQKAPPSGELASRSDD